jgi:hypothetical protein
MLQIRANDSHRYCDGLTRRSFLQAGVLGLGGLGLADALRLKAQAKAAGQASRDTAVILIWLDGGPTHIDSYDLKPDAPAEYRGEMKPTKTNVPGIEICDLMPCQARIMDKLALVRSLNHTTSGHFTGAHWMLTGYQSTEQGKPVQMHPSAGSITAKLRGANRRGLPAYVGVPVARSDDDIPGYHSAAYLGISYNPFQVGSDPSAPNFGVQNLTLPGGITLDQLADRRRLLGSFDSLRRDIDRGGTMDVMDQFQREAYELISGPLARQAFDISQEDPRLRDRYSRHTWGQSCVLARRLVEAGVTFVSVYMGGWDQHGGIMPACRGELPILDRAVGTLVEDLADRGLYERVAICVCGEFGRTPRINAKAGRDHWGQAGFCVLGGGGLNTGLVVGATNEKGEYPKDRPVGPGDMWATLYHVLGIDTSLTLHDKLGRPHPVLAAGAPIVELV